MFGKQLLFIYKQCEFFLNIFFPSFSVRSGNILYNEYPEKQVARVPSWYSGCDKSNLSVIKVLVEIDLLTFLLHLCAKKSVQSCKFTEINIAEYMTSVTKIEPGTVFCSCRSFVRLTVLLLKELYQYLMMTIYVMLVCNSLSQFWFFLVLYKQSSVFLCSYKQAWYVHVNLLCHCF